MRIRTRTLVLGLIAALAVSVVAGPNWSRLGSRMEPVLERLGVHLPQGERASDPAYALLSLPSLPQQGWVNGDPESEASLRGKIAVLVVFSDTHPGAMNALQRVQAWHDAYERYGVRVIGVHAPEFSFAADPSVTSRFIGRLGLSFPVLHDPSLKVLGELRSRAADVQVLVADPDGRVQKPRVVRNVDVDGDAIEHAIRGQVRALNPDVAFPEDFGLGRAVPGVRFDPVTTIRLGVPSSVRGPLARATPGRAQPFTAQFRHQIEGDPLVPYPVGWWTPGAEGLEAGQGGAANFVAIRYDAGRTGVVASPPPGRPARLWILRDEDWLPDDARGPDVRRDARGATYVDVTEPRLYLIALGSGEHVLKLSPESAGMKLYAFTFETDAPVTAR